MSTLSSGIGRGVIAHIPLVGRFRLLWVALGLALALLVVTAIGAQAFSRTKDFVGTGFGSSEIVNPDECAATGECHAEMTGEFDAGEMGMGTVSFRFSDDWSEVTGQQGSCSAPAEGANDFIWEVAEGEGLVMTQTIGFICPSLSGEIGYWKRVLRIEEGTGRFDGAKGTVFVSGSRVMETGEETWSFDGSITFPKEQRDGCFRAYFLGDLIVIPPKNTSPPYTPTLSFWLCGDDVTLQGPNPREDYEIFNPFEDALGAG